MKLKGFRMHSNASFFIIYSLLPIIIWLDLLLLTGKNDLPGGNVFVLMLLEVGGRMFGYIVGLFRLPPMIGMLGMGLAVRNIPYFNLTQNWNPSLSSPVRQLAIAVVLTRAGFGLDMTTLLKYKWLVLRLAALPTIVEGLTIAVLTHFILDFPWVWGILLGYVVAAVSPAVIVPRILELKSKGYGEKKGVATVALAAATLDDAVAISFFGIALGFVVSTKGAAEMMIQGPLELIACCGFGLIWGSVSGIIFNPTGEHANGDMSVIRGMFILGGGITSVFGFKLVNHSGAGAVPCIIAAFVTCSLWKARGFHEKELNQVRWGLTFLWQFFEPLLFGVIGIEMVIENLAGRVVLLSVACHLIAAMVRFCTTYLTVCKTGLNTKEKLFIAISWIPKATVQAALGPIALEHAKALNDNDPNKAMSMQLASQVVTSAVVVILLTAPIGEFLVMFSGTRLLTKMEENETDSSTPTIEKSNQIQAA